jgi:ubiquinone/menaquinone biosynthesis C-methylase UbiE
LEEHVSENSIPDLHFYDPQKIKIADFPAEGYILDVGGGGEGIIGQLKGQQVVAIDRRKSELEEAPEGPLKIVMDASDLKFLDGTFQTVTAFFSLMFMPKDLHRIVFEEINRVLKPGGNLRVWDINVRTPFILEKRGFAFRLDVNLPEKLVQTGYGYRWPEDSQDLEYYLDLAQKVGFQVLEQREVGKTFYLLLAKPENEKKYQEIVT